MPPSTPTSPFSAKRGAARHALRRAWSNGCCRWAAALLCSTRFRSGGDWKVSASGRSPGFQIVVFGGPKADIPINGESGHALGQLLAGTKFSAVLDMGEVRKAEQARLVGDVLDHLYTISRDPLWPMRST
jgi:hypothetical protein